MADLQLTLSAQERDCLIQLLETALKNRQVEEHRTRTPSYREHVVQEEQAIASILIKLGKPPQ